VKVHHTLCLATFLVTMQVALAVTADNELSASVKAGQVADSIAPLEKALRSAGGDEKTILAIQLAHAQIAAGLLISAQQTAETALRDASSSFPQRNTLVLLNAHLREANGSPAEALSAYRTLAEKTPAVPERAEALAGAIRAATQLGATDITLRSLDDFTAAFPQDSRSREFLLRLYRLRASKNDNRGAAEIVHRYKASYPADPVGAALSETVHLFKAGDSKGALAAFEFERKLPTFTLTPPIASSVIESARRDPASAALITQIANEFGVKTGDPQFQVSAVELLTSLHLGDQAIALGNTLLPKLAGTAWGPLLRLALANALSLDPKTAVESEKLLIAFLADNPANDAAWNLYREVTARSNSTDAYPKLLEQTLEKLPEQKNVTLRAAAQNQIRFRLLKLAVSAHDVAGTIKNAKAFLETDGLSSNGPEVIKIFADTCFTELPEDAKTGPEADAARAAFGERFAILLSSLERYLTRTIAWGPALKSLDVSITARLAAYKTVAPSLKIFNDMLARVNGNPIVKASLDFQRLRGNGANVDDSTTAQAEQLMPRLLEAGGAAALEGGVDLINIINQAHQPKKVISASQLYFEKIPGATGPLSMAATAILQLGAPQNAALGTLLTDAVAKAGGNPWPLDGMSQSQSVQSFLFSIAEQNRLPADMQKRINELNALYPGSLSAFDYLRRLGVVQIATGDLVAAKATLLAADNIAKTIGAEPDILSILAKSSPDSSDWVLPLLDDYLARPSRGPQQGTIQLLRAHLLLTGKKDPVAARQSLGLAASRPTDLLWETGNLPMQWLDTLVKKAISAQLDASTPEQIALLADADAVSPNGLWTPALIVRQAQGGNAFDFAERLNRYAAAQNPSDTNKLTGVFFPSSQQLVAIGKPELAGLVLRSAMNRFTGVSADLRTQTEQSLFSLGGKSGLRATEIDEKLEWAPLLKAAASFSDGDSKDAWNRFEKNETLFDKYSEKLPSDFLRWISEQLLKRDEDSSHEKAEKILRRWIINNENATAVPAEEKAKTQLQLTDVYFKTLRYDLARSECLSLINHFPDTPQAVEAQFRIGECYLNQKMYTEAAKAFEVMAKSKDKKIASRGEFFLGVLAQQRGDTEEAKARFHNVMDLSPSKEVSNEILFRLSELYGQDKRYSDQLTLLRSIGIIGSSAKLWHTPGMPLNIVIQDTDLGVSRGQSYIPVVVTTTSGDREVVRLEPSLSAKGFFRAELPTQLGDPKPGDHILQVTGGDVISYDYTDDFKKQFTSIAPPPSAIHLASDAEFRISSTEIKENEEVSSEERERENNRGAGKQAGLEFRQEFRDGSQLKPGNNIFLQVKDPDRDVSKDPDIVSVLLTASTSGSRATAKLTETGPHTGIFRGTIPTIEIPVNIFASDHSSSNDAMRAVDNNPKTFWEGLNDERAPKFIVVDLKQATKLGTFKWTSDALAKDKVPVEFAVQVSNDLNEWKTVAATAKFTGSTDTLAKRVTQTSSDNVTRVSIDISGTEGRYVRLFIEKFSGSTPRIAELEVADVAGTLLVPAKTSPAGDVANGLCLTPRDQVTAVYEDQFNMVLPDKPRYLTQQLRCTYCDGKIGFIGYEFVPVQGRSEPERFIKQVRRVEPGDRVVVSITDFDLDTTDQRDKVKFGLSTSDGKKTVMEATETKPFSGVFTKEFDIWSPQKTNGLKFEPGVTLEAHYLDEQNTDHGNPVMRVAPLDPVAPADVKVSFIPSSVKVSDDGEQKMVYTPSNNPRTNGIKSVAFEPPLTFEIIDPAAAKDSFSEVTAILTTSNGSRAEVICPLSSFHALETGRFVGQILMKLGDKDSPSTSVREFGDTRSLIQRNSPAASKQSQQIANVVPVFNINGQDIITVTYKVGDREYTDQARLAVTPSVEFTDSKYDKPVDELYIGEKVFVKVRDLTADVTADADSVDITITSPRGEKFTTKLMETLGHSGEFTGSFPLVASEKPVPGTNTMQAYFGDTLTLTYTSKGDGALKIEKTINVVKGTDAKLLVFEKKYGAESIAIESQFRMAEAYFELFKNYRNLKQDDQANKSLSEGLQLLKELHENYPSKAYEARTDYLLGQFAQELKKYDEAIGYYRDIISNHSGHPLAPDAQYKLGQCEEENGDMDAASADYVTLAYTWPDNPLVANVIVRISEYFYNKMEYPAAADVAMKFVERFPQHEWAERMFFRAGQCRFKAAEFQKAGENFDHLAENYPHGHFTADAIFWAGESYRSAGSAEQLEKAYRRYKRVTWDYPESEAARYARGKLVLPELATFAGKDAAE